MGELRRFWFTFKNPPPFNPLGLGCGVTARDHADAIEILTAKVFGKTSVLFVETVIEDVDIQTLDQDHVLPNMGFVTNRGVWFPQGY